MSYSLEPAYAVRNKLVRALLKAGTNPENQWFFTDGAFIPDQMIEYQPNTYQKDDFAVISDNKIIAFFSAQWNKQLQIIVGFRIICLNSSKSMEMSKAIFTYFDYLFVARGCKVLNFLVADKNVHAKNIYDKFTTKYFGHVTGHRTRGQMSYTGEISDVTTYEVTCDEYFAWKNRNAS